MFDSWHPVVYRKYNRQALMECFLSVQVQHIRDILRGSNVEGEGDETESSAGVREHNHVCGQSTQPSIRHGTHNPGHGQNRPEEIAPIIISGLFTTIRTVLRSSNTVFVVEINF